MWYLLQSCEISKESTCTHVCCVGGELKTTVWLTALFPASTLHSDSPPKNCFLSLATAGLDLGGKGFCPRPFMSVGHPHWKPMHQQVNHAPVAQPPVVVVAKLASNWNAEPRVMEFLIVQTKVHL